jgi:hypothetical protein
MPTFSPSKEPTTIPSARPSVAPTSHPTSFPSASPSTKPSSSPSILPSVSPTTSPSDAPISSKTGTESVQVSDRKSTHVSQVPHSTESGDIVVEINRSEKIDANVEAVFVDHTKIADGSITISGNDIYSEEVDRHILLHDPYKPIYIDIYHRIQLELGHNNVRNLVTATDVFINPPTFTFQTQQQWKCYWFFLYL